MFAVQSPIALLGQCIVDIKKRCHKLIATACDPYRPERHYMRGPGPKWFATHGVASIERSREAMEIDAQNSATSAQKCVIPSLLPVGRQ
jgi:hypothetical protein